MPGQASVQEHTSPLISNVAQGPKGNQKAADRPVLFEANLAYDLVLLRPTAPLALRIAEGCQIPEHAVPHAGAVLASALQAGQQLHRPYSLHLHCGLAYNVRWTVGYKAMFKGDKECW